VGSTQVEEEGCLLLSSKTSTVQLPAQEELPSPPNDSLSSAVSSPELESIKVKLPKVSLTNHNHHHFEGDTMPFVHPSINEEGIRDGDGGDSVTRGTEDEQFLPPLSSPSSFGATKTCVNTSKNYLQRPFGDNCDKVDITQEFFHAVKCTKYEMS